MCHKESKANIRHARLHPEDPADPAVARQGALATRSLTAEDYDRAIAAALTDPRLGRQERVADFCAEWGTTVVLTVLTAATILVWFLVSMAVATRP